MLALGSWASKFSNIPAQNNNLQSIGLGVIIHRIYLKTQPEIYWSEVCEP